MFKGISRVAKAAAVAPPPPVPPACAAAADDDFGSDDALFDTAAITLLESIETKLPIKSQQQRQHQNPQSCPGVGRPSQSWTPSQAQTRVPALQKAVGNEWNRPVAAAGEVVSTAGNYAPNTQQQQGGYNGGAVTRTPYTSNSSHLRAGPQSCSSTSAPASLKKGINTQSRVVGGSPPSSNIKPRDQPPRPQSQQKQQQGAQKGTLRKPQPQKLPDSDASRNQLPIPHPQQHVQPSVPPKSSFLFTNSLQQSPCHQRSRENSHHQQRRIPGPAGDLPDDIKIEDAHDDPTCEIPLEVPAVKRGLKDHQSQTNSGCDAHKRQRTDSRTVEGGFRTRGDEVPENDEDFSSLAWRTMCDAVQADAIGGDSIVYGLRDITQGAVYGKISAVIVIIQDLKVTGPDAAAVFKDPTGTMSGSIHGTVFDTFPNIIPGVVLHLKQVAVFKPGAVVYLNVTARNVAHVVYPDGSSRAPRVAGNAAPF